MMIGGHCYPHKHLTWHNERTSTSVVLPADPEFDSGQRGLPICRTEGAIDTVWRTKLFLPSSLPAS